MEKSAVADSSTLIFIAKLDIFNLIKNVFSKLFLPEAVIKELFKKDCYENELIKKEIDQFLFSSQIKDIKDFPLGAGEKEAISLCLEKKIKILLSDDKKARTYAKSLGINVMGILGLLLLSLKENRLNKKEFFKLLNDLVEKGYYLSPALYAQVIKKIEEI